VRAFLEIKGMRSQWWTIPMGVYRVNQMKISGRYTAFDLAGLESVIQDYRFHIPRQLPMSPTDSAEITLARLILEAIPTAQILWMVKRSQAVMNQVTFDRDRWAAIDGDASSKSIAGSVSGDCWADRNGSFITAVTPIDTGPLEPVWTVTVDSGVKVSSSTSLTRENMRNVWTVWAAPSGKPVIGPVHTWDADPKSPTYAGTNPILNGAAESSAFGIVSGFYQSPILADLEQCAMAGRKRLALSLASRRHVEVSSIFNPTIDAGDCVALVADDTKRLEKFIVERVSYKMDDAQTALSMRTSGPAALSESDEEQIITDVGAS
jgi:hypothetical protein